MSNVIPLCAGEGHLRAEPAWRQTVEKLMLEARQIRSILACNSSNRRASLIVTAIDMWWRQRSGLRLVAAGTADAVKRAEIEARLAEREAAMARLIERAQLGDRLDG
jgi:hypothetical protein